MINVFNRKNVLTTSSLEKFSNAKNVLASHGIEFSAKIDTNERTNASVFGASRRSSGTFGNKLGYAHSYNIYVLEKDEETARYYLGRPNM